MADTRMIAPAPAATTAEMAGSLAIRWRLTIWIALAFALAIAAIFVALWLAVAAILNNDVEDDLTANFFRIEGAALLSGDNDSRQDELTLYPFPVVIYGPSGEVYRNADADLEVMRLSEEDQLRVVASQEIIDETLQIRGEEFRVRASRVTIGDLGVGYAMVGRNTQTVHDVREALATILVGGGVIAVVVVFAVAYWLARNALRPVERITRLASDIGASDLKRRIAVRSQPAEIQHLADCFDGMLARLESAFGQQRNFVMDVSHELRTPLTGLRGNLDVTLMDPSLDPEMRAQLEKMSSEVSRLIRLTANLLYLAHAEAGRDVARRPVELDALALEVVYQERNVRPEVTLRLAHEEQVNVEGDRDLLKQLLLNVVDNAIKYSPAGGEVLISLSQDDDSVVVAVEDSGPGIPAAQADKVFERFYRVDGNQSKTVGGTGIGLAISKWIAQVHGGDIRVASRDGGGSRFIITLPVASQQAALTAALP